MEEWKSIPGYEGYYEASDNNKIKSIAHIDALGRIKPDRILKPQKRSGGYLSVMLYKDNIGTVHNIHRLIMGAFEGVSELQVDHKNGDRSDNRLCNLEYVTARENVSRGFIRSGSSSIHTGVCWHKHKSQWQARIEIKGKVFSLGYYDNEEMAGEAYQSKLKSIENEF